MINYDFLKFFFSYNKKNLKTFIRILLGLIILVFFETYLISSLNGDMDFLNNNYFKLFVLLPALVNINIYWFSFKSSDFYKVIGLIPIRLRDFLITLNIYILISNTLPRLFFIIILPFYSYIFGGGSLLNCIIKILLFLLVILTAQKVCIIFYESKNKIIKVISTLLLMSTVFMGDFLSIFILYFINIIINFNFADSNISLIEKNKKDYIRRKNHNFLLYEFFNFTSDKSNIISYVIMGFFLLLITYNFNSAEQFNFQVVYFLLLLVISYNSPLNLLFSSNKEERNTFIYLPIPESTLFKVKFLFATLLSQLLLFLCIFYNTVIFSHPLTLQYVNLPVVLLVCNFIRLKMDYYFPILDWENKSDLWKNHKKYYSFLLIIPYIYLGLSISIIPLIFVTIFIHCIIKYIFKKFKVEANYFALKIK